MRVAVAGAGGQLGAAVVHEFAQSHETIPLTRADVDITDDAAVSAAIDRIQPDAIINCAGYNDVDGAEDHPIEALNANAFAARAFAHAARARGAIFIQYSSDFVFDGTKPEPYTEEDRPNPRSVYSRLKIAGRMVRGRRPARIRHARGDSVRTGARWPTAQRIDWRDGEEAPSRRGSRRLRRSDRFANVHSRCRPGDASVD